MICDVVCFPRRCIPSLATSHTNLSISIIDKRRYYSMLNYRVQTCLDSTTYNLLEKYMEENGYETASMAVRKILRDFLGTDSGEEPCECVLSEIVKL